MSDGDERMRVDLVAAPTRYPRGPLVLLVLIAAIPAVGLLVLHRWADAEADEFDRAVRGTGAVDDGAPDPVPEPDQDESMPATAVYDLRRAPRSLAEIARLQRLRTTVAPLLDLVDPRSCAAVSMGGAAAGAVNARRAVIPGSLQKLFVAAVALEVLGPEHRFRTTVAAPPAVDGVIDGDLYLIGGGDPLLTADDYPIEEDPYPATSTTSLDRLADAVAASGVTFIAGSVVGDGTRYDDEYVVDTWADGVAFVEAGPYDALMVNDARVLLSPGRQSDPVSAGARELVRLLNDRGVTVAQGWTNGEAPPDVPELGSVESAPLTDVVAEMLTTSDDNTAEMMVKEIGFVDRGEGTRIAGINVIDRTLRGWGVPMGGVRILDGSGLSAANQTTCAAVLAVLRRESDGPLPGALPVAGRSGTLAAELVESPIAGRLRAKTGTLGNPPVAEPPPATKALAGYVMPSRPRRARAQGIAPLEMVVILNGPDVDAPGQFRPVWEEFGRALAGYPEGPPPAALGPR